MKHDVLRTIAHNIAHSLGGGFGPMVGAYGLDIYGEARESAEGFIAVDFLNGTTVGAKPSDAMARAIQLYREALPGLCAKHGASLSSFKDLTVRYLPRAAGGDFIVTIVDQNERRSVTEYSGYQACRTKIMDRLGRLRPIRATE